MNPTHYNRSLGIVTTTPATQALNTIVIPLNHPNAFAAVITAFKSDNVIFTAKVEGGNFVIAIK